MSKPPMMRMSASGNRYPRRPGALSLEAEMAQVTAAMIADGRMPDPAAAPTERQEPLPPPPTYEDEAPATEAKVGEVARQALGRNAITGAMPEADSTSPTTLYDVTGPGIYVGSVTAKGKIVFGDVETTQNGSVEGPLPDPDYDDEMHSAGDVVLGRTIEHHPYEN